MNRTARLLSSAVVLCAAAVAVAQDPPASMPAKADPVPAAKLKAALPESFAGLKRTQATGQRSVVGEMRLTTAEATYGSADAPPTATVNLTDYGYLPEALDALAVWAKMPIETDSDTETMKSTTVAGHPAMETYTKDAKRLQVQVAVGKRFLAAVTIEGMELDAAREAMKKFDFKAVEAAGK